MDLILWFPADSAYLVATMDNIFKSQSFIPNTCKKLFNRSKSKSCFRKATFENFTFYFLHNKCNI